MLATTSKTRTKRINGSRPTAAIMARLISLGVGFPTMEGLTRYR